MRFVIGFFLLLIATMPGSVQANGRVHTYSIVARDSKTGELGVAVQSHWFQVGTLVPWAEAGVGAIATQALTNASFGPRGLALLRQGKSPKEVVTALLAIDSKAENRQLLVVDAKGRVAAHTGRHCIRDAGHTLGRGFAAAGNMMRSKRVWAQMARAFRSSRGKLAERMMAALKAGQRAGGDVRGMQSAALLVVPARGSDKVWQERPLDFRVADHPKPLRELERLLRIKRAYQTYFAAERALAQGKSRLAKRRFAAVRKLVPRNLELPFWQALALYKAGDKEMAIKLFAEVIAKKRSWFETLRRLPSGKLLTRAQLAAIINRLPPALKGTRK